MSGITRLEQCAGVDTQVEGSECKYDLIFSKFLELGSVRQTLLSFLDSKEEGNRYPEAYRQGLPWRDC